MHSFCSPPPLVTRTSTKSGKNARSLRGVVSLSDVCEPTTGKIAAALAAEEEENEKKKTTPWRLRRTTTTTTTRGNSFTEITKRNSSETDTTCVKVSSEI